MDSRLSPPGNHSNSPDRRTKRRKVTVACDECRARKIRCDGAHPVCGPCVSKADKGARCAYSGEWEKKQDMRNYISRLEDRIKHLESPASRHVQAGHRSPLTYDPVSSDFHVRQSSGFSPSLLAGVGHQQRKTSAASGPEEHSFAGSVFESTTGGNANHVNRHAIPSSQSPGGTVQIGERRDGVNAMMGAVEEERPTQGFFGSSSAASFMRQIKTAVDKRVASSDQRIPDLGGAVPASLMSTRNEGAPSSVPNYVLPPRKMADSLMDVYWTEVFPLYPLVDSAHMRAEYAKMWTGDSLQSDENMLMCTFNVIFALSCQLADFIQPEEREASADSFFTRAKGLLHFNLWNTGSAGLIQCLLLMAQYLQSTDSAHQCWIVTGLAVRNAQSLGLHLPQTITQLPTFQEQQLARKIWHGCVLMDRVISMTFGRPAMLSKASYGSVPLPATVDEEYISATSGADVAQPADRPSMMAFYSKSLELYEIMNDVLLSLYKPVPEDSSEDIHDFYFNKETNEGERTIFELDRALTRWARSLPPHLSNACPPASQNPIFHRQSIVLRARFLHVRILLFRPILSKYCTARDTASDPLISLNDSFPHRVALQCSIICVKVAQEIIELVHSNIPTGASGGPLPAWWYNILYIYSAAMVLIAARLRPAILAEVPESSITRSWNCALEILRKYQRYSASARRCVAALEILYKRVVSEALVMDQASNDQGAAAPNVSGELALGEGMDAAFLEGFDLPDFQDMSWLNSVPSNLY
ncbi:transcription factor [Aspergillus sclerotialis]|uniref:Transcription factor n=1 Tax=Aspergillus sclerotialis TaxID=2070753 RepID=A0A3A2ZLA1_9EURO|nr:transcription factor [Aspergillus sclerotialis]